MAKGKKKGPRKAPKGSKGFPRPSAKLASRPAQDHEAKHEEMCGMEGGY